MTSLTNQTSHAPKKIWAKPTIEVISVREAAGMPVAEALARNLPTK